MNRLLSIALHAVAYVIVLHDRYIDWLIKSPTEETPGRIFEWRRSSKKADRTFGPVAASGGLLSLSVGFPIFGPWVIVLSGVSLVVSGYFAFVVIRDVYARPKE
ncbi:MAG: hypothetical protein ACOYBY_16490 [Dermatophilaceae bacterium]